MKKNVAVLLLVFLCPFVCLAQGENNVWVFGQQTGLDFNTSPPTVINTRIQTFEGAASISDAAGNLLFYSNSDSVWNRNHEPMPNGFGLIGNGFGYGGFSGSGGSSEQGMGIVKDLNNPDRYYLFSLDCAEDIGGVNTTGKLRYTIIDMSLDGGLGDVVTGSKNIVVDSFMSEKMTLIKGNDCTTWLLGYKYNTYDIMAYKIDQLGVHTGVATPSTVTIPPGYTSNILGQMNATSDGNRVGVSYYSNNDFEVADFDKTTGILSNFTKLQVNSNIFGLEFSPDGSKVYVADGVATVHQFDLASFPNAALVQATQASIAGTGFPPNSTFYAFRTAPDGNIYVVGNSLIIGRITSPNMPPPTCQHEFFTTLPGTLIWSMGNNVLTDYSIVLGDTVTHLLDTMMCHGAAYEKNIPSGYTDVLWHDGDVSYSRFLSNAGLYIVDYNDLCGHHYTDSIRVRLIESDLNFWTDTVLCAGGSFVLQPGITNAQSYTWSTGETTGTIVVNHTGTYTVQLVKDDCISSDTITVTEIVPELKITESDTLICIEKPLTLHTLSKHTEPVFWNTGAVQQTLTVNQAGIYVAHAKGVCGMLADSVTIEAISCTCNPFVPNAFTPNNDGNNDRFDLEMRCAEWSGFQLRIYNRFGECVFVGSTPTDAWDGTFKGQPCDIGTYFYDLHYSDIVNKDVRKHGDLVLIR